MPEPVPAPVPEDEPSLADLRAALGEAAGVASGLWVSYLFSLFYVLLAVAGVTHKDLLLQNGIKLPFLGIELPLLGFFWLGPILLIVAHAYVLHHLCLLAEKARLLDERLARAPAHERGLLPVNLFVQMLIGRPAGEWREANRISALVAWVTLVAGPVLVLAFFVLQFLPYHDEATTWWGRLAVVLDLALLWWLWPSVACRSEPSWRGPDMSRRCRAATTWLAVATCYLVFGVATFAGEWLEAALPPMPLHQTLVGGQLDENNFLSRSLWSNRLILSGVVVFDRQAYDTPAKLAAAPSPRSLRNRHLEQAILTEAQLSHVDLSGAHLEGASLVRARAEGAWFDRATMTGAQLDDGEMEGASFYNTHLVGATLSGASLQGAQLAGANLQAAWMPGAAFDGASLAGADLRRATLTGARLAGANLKGAFLQGASLAEAVLDGAALDQAFLAKTDFRDASAKPGLRASQLDLTREDAPCVAPPNGACDPAETSERINALIVRYVPDNASRVSMLDRRVSTATLEPWPQRSLPALSDSEPALAALWARIACSNRAAPFVILTLLDTFDDSSWTRPRFKNGAKMLMDALQQPGCAAAMALSEASKMRLLDLDKNRPEQPVHPAAPEAPDATARPNVGLSGHSGLSAPRADRDASN